MKYDELENPRKEKEELLKVMTEDKTEVFYELAKEIHACNEKQRVHYGGSLTVLTESASYSYSNRQYEPQIIYTKQEYSQEIYSIYQRALQTLTLVQKRRWHLFYEGGKTYTEIAIIEGVDESCIRESIQRARKKLQKFFQKFQKTPPKWA